MAKLISVRATRREGYRRYGHAWPLQPVICHVGAKGKGRPKKLEKGAERWLSFVDYEDLAKYATTPNAPIAVQDPDVVSLEVAERAQELSAMQSEIARLRGEAEGLEGKLRELETERAALEAQKDELGRLVERAERQKGEAEREAETAKRKVTQLEEKLAAMADGARSR